MNVFLSVSEGTSKLGNQKMGPDRPLMYSEAPLKHPRAPRINVETTLKYH